MIMIGLLPILLVLLLRASATVTSGKENDLGATGVNGRRLASTIQSFEVLITFNNFLGIGGDLTINFNGNNGGPVGAVTVTAPPAGEIATSTFCLDAGSSTEIEPDISDDEDQLLDIVVTPSVCACGVDVCFDPHLQGLRGQRIEWAGVDGGWYAFVRDDEEDLQINVRTTSPLPDDFPERGFITGLAVLSEGHTLVIKVADPYSARTPGCSSGVSPCLADGGLSVLVDGEAVGSLAGPSDGVHLPGGIELSAFNVPLECREFGGRKAWARTQNILDRHLSVSWSFEEWMLSFKNMVSPEYCSVFVTNRELSRVQSDQTLARIITPSVVVRLAVGINQRHAGKTDRFGRDLPEMNFWQMSVGLDGISLEHEAMSGLLGETAHAMVDAEGENVMTGVGAIPGNVEDYRVSDAESRDFDLLRFKDFDLH